MLISSGRSAVPRIFLSAIVDGGAGIKHLYTLILEESLSVMGGTVSVQVIGTGNAMNPSVVNKTAANAQTGFTVAANTEYKVGDNPTALKITNSSAVNGWWRVILTTGASVDASNSLVLPAWCYCNETALKANTRYEFICSDAGNVAVGMWSTS